MVACLNAMLDPLAYYFTTETFRKKMDKDSVRTALRGATGDPEDQSIL